MQIVVQDSSSSTFIPLTAKLNRLPIDPESPASIPTSSIGKNGKSFVTVIRSPPLKTKAKRVDESVAKGLSNIGCSLPLYAKESECSFESEKLEIAKHIYSLRRQNYRVNKDNRKTMKRTQPPKSILIKDVTICTSSIGQEEEKEEGRSRNVHFNDQELDVIYAIPRVDPEDWSACYYEEEELNQMRYDFFLEEIENELNGVGFGI